MPLIRGNVTDFSVHLAKNILGWEAVTKDAVHDRQTLCDYLDGGALVLE